MQDNKGETWLSSQSLHMRNIGAFAGAKLDRLGEKRDDAAWLEAIRKGQKSRFICLDDYARLAIDKATNEPVVLDYLTLKNLHIDNFASLLGANNDEVYFVVQDDLMTKYLAAKAVTWMTLREAGASLSPFYAGLFAFGKALLYWQQHMQFCPSCGSRLILEAGGHRARCQVLHCGQLQFPRTDPAVIVLVERDGRCLLGRQSKWGPHRYSTLAGFVEPDETPEQAVIREVNEEAGIHVLESHYLGAQPWPFPASLMLGYIATAGNDTIKLRDGELEDARWFSAEDMLAQLNTGQLVLPTPVSIAWQLINHWLKLRANIDLAKFNA